MFSLFRKPWGFSKFTLSWRFRTIRDFAPCEARPTLRALDCGRLLKKATQKLSHNFLQVRSASRMWCLRAAGALPFVVAADNRYNPLTITLKVFEELEKLFSKSFSNVLLLSKRGALACEVAGGIRYLQIEAARVCIEVKHLACKIKSRNKL